MKLTSVLQFILWCCIAFSLSAPTNAADKIKFETDPAQRLDARYRLFRTENMWNFLELDTQTGRLWQIQFSVEKRSNRVKLPVNSTPLAPEGKNGRFTLYPTDNMWNFILVDQDDGRVWQAQFSVDDATRGIFPILSDQDVYQMLIDKPPKKQD